MPPLPSRQILVGICGGVAAYKALDVVSGLRKRGHRVQVVMTEAATRFVQPASFAAVSGSPVLTTLWPDVSRGTLEDHYPHLYPATQTDLFLLIPATANSIGKIARGMGDDLLSTCCLSLPASCAKLFCPAMNVEMWHNPIVQGNVRALESEGWTRLGPDAGHLACGMTGEGRLREPGAILEEIDRHFMEAQRLSGKTVLILSGPTHEHLDPIRYLGNPSSGKMGKALAEAARRQGAKVAFVTGPVPETNLPEGVALHPVVSAQEMLDTARSLLADCDAVIYAAAVADFRPATRSDSKLPKAEQALDIRLLPNPDIAATLNREKKPGVTAIGFALQTHDGESHAREKLANKGLDGIVLNAPDSLGAPSGTFHYLAKGGDTFEHWGTLDKTRAARNILAKI
ncbi:MAG: bifunctional phosphopantothenoylcysteine decarboxylase/phosphopantothenate--cysteine ligase CoaBC [Verrucomicrobia bacterium]|nr:bifunctional phosphopantothenoylcysteine decarboxylase/phosphopantothenate--cysteine ligase CoaBC [Verrucomicrobiota bacterium]MCH8514058.1 bifunctional phosphopantothenoylcysteine decarboxylase/phosphopantothenate--cysteine ligase CoaBC [Kiritimatiellia bacterium]